MDDTMAHKTRSQTPKISPFLEPGKTTQVGSLAILQLSRDNLQPVYLKAPSGKHDGYAEGAVVNTRYGSFPHSTMIGVPWGSQIRASKVDTGSRGRNNKRKRNKSDDDGKEASATVAEEKTEQESTPAEVNDDSAAVAKKIVADVSGFIHILPPTPEVWTSSLPHRTQVVYTPDYSYVLHRIRARPGSVLIEAGAGSGSFSHASVRAVYNGYPSEGERKGKVYSFEFHEQRFHKMNQELKEHNLNSLVHLTHRDVYNGGFLIDGKSPGAEAIFLDLPAPWEALHHLSRRNPKNPEDKEWVSPLNPKKSAHICTFSPCIEQVTKTVSAMRRLGWVDIDMVEIANRKYHTSRERVGLNLSMDRGVNNSARDVDEALSRLTEIEARFREHAARSKESDDEVDGDEDDGLIKQREKKEQKGGRKRGGEKRVKIDHKPDSPECFEALPSGVPMWMEGRLITRGEPEIKTHTSYLVFATLPIEWTEEDEAAAAARHPVIGEQKVIGLVDKAARKQERREQLQKATGNRKARRMERAAELAATAEEEVGVAVP
ncbi:tRNA (adenine-N(1)-)-methyltransferase catalytic subunit trm61 [Podospora pseudopauciseta]|uniref:tRNA (adenine(58)-N(1))-methyltransferase catalytic subunit TRM61 n=1 Tax=Podospora pseudopauciseta TaxID=2093780 RepID=A0ABR0HQD1_9PEZI|nr:tRNA (adenine-N(1)-)-methyltransferase catalytic subunit trm61 [Podospora pseudopauciseta]